MNNDLTPQEVIREVAEDFSSEELRMLAVNVRHGRILTKDLRKRAAYALIGLACVLDALPANEVTHEQA